MSFYKTVVDTAVRNSSHSIILDLVPAGSTVLDVGCASGYLARALVERGCTVSGVEYDAADAEEARDVLERLEIADLNARALDDIFEAGSFDAVVFGDVLEHVLDPAAALRSARALLRPGGAVIVSIPNVAHGALRLSLLLGEWDYQDTGLLDRTHIRFYTHDSLVGLLRSAGLAPTEIHATVFDPLATEVPVDADRLPVPVVEWVRDQPHASVYQFVLRAEPSDDPAAADVPDVRPAVQLERPHDEHARRAEELAALVEAASADPQAQAATITDLRHRLMTSRDHAIGTEAELGVARRELEWAHAEIGKAQADAIDAHARLRAALDEVTALRQQMRRAHLLGPIVPIGRRVKAAARRAVRG